jgi:hypothetical protein
MGQLALVNKSAGCLAHLATQALTGSCSHLNIVNQHGIGLVSPQYRQESKVTPQLSSSMGSREVGQVGSQRNVVFGIKNM